VALPKGWGWVVVHSKIAAKVFIHGKQAGDVETPIAWGCGPRVIALARLDKYGNPVWMTSPQWYNIKCGNVISEVTIK